MKLQTQIPLQTQDDNPIDYHSKLLLIGSCFVENMGEKFNYFKFQNLQNPFGILFHPQAIEKLITNAINEKVYTDKDVFFQNDQWHCFEAHSKLSSVSKTDLIHMLNSQIRSTNKFLKSATHIIITLGTAWVYRNIESDTIVANCHKIPQKQFLKELLSVELISKSLQTLEALIKSVNPKASIIFTVSPVRHLKDGFIENTQSKAHLISAIHQFINQQSLINNQQSFYFPSFEIMMDELRDYRFYAEDMLHPNQTAIHYIWEKLKQVWISDQALNTMEDVDTIQKGLQHKPFHPNSEAHQQFIRALEVKKAKLQSAYSHITF